MPSARRHKRAVGKRRSSLGIIVKPLIFLLVLLLGFLFIKLNTKYWDGEGKVSVVVPKASGEVAVILLDPELSEETEFVIPAETEVEVSQNLGVIRIKNVRQLGINEGIGGTLLPKTILKSFLFPVYLWSDQTPDNLKFITTRNSNIPIGDKIAMMLFTKKIKNLDSSSIDLGKSQFLTKTKLSDGTVGYKIPGEVSQRLTFYFSDNEFSEKGTRVYIKDASGTFGVAEKVGNIVEVMGAKVVSLEKVETSEIECAIGGKDKEAIVKISRLFDCKLNKSETEFDVEITLGSKFIL
jgi:hypothetical protein